MGAPACNSLNQLCLFLAAANLTGMAIKYKWHHLKNLSTVHLFKSQEVKGHNSIKCPVITPNKTASKVFMELFIRLLFLTIFTI